MHESGRSSLAPIPSRRFDPPLRGYFSAGISIPGPLPVTLCSGGVMPRMRRHGWGPAAGRLQSAWDPIDCPVGAVGAGIVSRTLVKVMGTFDLRTSRGRYLRRSRGPCRSGICCGHGRRLGTIGPDMYGFASRLAAFGTSMLGFGGSWRGPCAAISAGGLKRFEERILGELTGRGRRSLPPDDPGSGLRSTGTTAPDTRMRTPAVHGAIETGHDPADPTAPLSFKGSWFEANGFRFPPINVAGCSKRGCRSTTSSLIGGTRRANLLSGCATMPTWMGTSRSRAGQRSRPVRGGGRMFAAVARAYHGSLAEREQDYAPRVFRPTIARPYGTACIL